MYRRPMATAFDPGHRPQGLEPWLGEIPDTLFDDDLYAACELSDRYATALALEVLDDLGAAAPLALGGSAAEIATALGLREDGLPALGALLDRLASAGLVERLPGDDRYRRVAPFPPSGRSALRATGLERAPAAAPTLDLLEAAAGAYPAHLREGRGGEELLMTPATIPLWLRYFSNDNPECALSNRIAAFVAANRLPPGRPLRLLEFGAGAGSAALALAAELERAGRLESVELYEVTEPSPFFRRRAERALAARSPSPPLSFRELDLDRPFEEQGVEPGFDLVYGVNVLHVARDLGDVLRRLRALLLPGGALVAGECFRLFARQPAPAELVFRLFRGFNGVEVDGEIRPRAGFLSPGEWRAALRACGYEAVQVVPDLDGIRERYPRFFAGALVGRAPSP